MAELAHRRLLETLLHLQACTSTIPPIAAHACARSNRRTTKVAADLMLQAQEEQGSAESRAAGEQTVGTRAVLMGESGKEDTLEPC